MTAILAIPIYGTWCSVIALALGASAYCEIIRRVSQVPPEPDPIWWESLLPRSITKYSLLTLAAGTVVPLWILNAADHQSPHWDGLGVAIAAASWSILPLLMLGVYGQIKPGTRPGFKRPAGAEETSFRDLAGARDDSLDFGPGEFGLDLIFYLAGNFPFFALDFLPMPGLPMNRSCMVESPIIIRSISVTLRIRNTSSAILMDFRRRLFVRGGHPGLAGELDAGGAEPAAFALSHALFPPPTPDRGGDPHFIDGGVRGPGPMARLDPRAGRTRPASTTPEPPTLIVPAPLT